MLFRSRLDDLSRLRVPLAKLLPFVSLVGHHPGRELDAAALGLRLRNPPVQATLF